MTPEFFDPTAEVCVTEGRLPHWYQPGATYFVTYRTHDSFPPAVARQWHSRRDDWLRTHRIDPRAPNWCEALRALPTSDRQAYYRQFSREFLAALDRGYGTCPLKQPDLAGIVADNLLHFDGERYNLSDFVVMPNHVHVLLGLLGNTTVTAQCYSWKKYTATRINQATGRSGHFWHPESFDHLVRTADHFQRFREYIAENPRTARLHDGEFILWQREVAGSRRGP